MQEFEPSTKGKAHNNLKKPIKTNKAMEKSNYKYKKNYPMKLGSIKHIKFKE